MKAKVKYPILGVKKGEIIVIQVEHKDYCLCIHENSTIRIDKKNLEIIRG